MASITLGGNPANTVGNLPAIHTSAPSFNLTKSDLSEVSLSDYAGSKLVLNIFPSVDTGTCAQSVRQFNQEAAELDNTKVLCISKDLPFAQQRFCGAEGIENVDMLSDYKTGNFGKDYGVTFADSAFTSLLSRSVVVINNEGNVVYTEQVSETADEPNYKAALEALMDA
ncbi:thiol peroxidase [Flagellimonas pacifica]|uniref:Thiol peroxidase n=1 Tax=Flagellimonas pacifica TaxID=1247520 RepID=A0A285MUB1_9FLAO|nr:thiol peroxidase [Allomuricauda parva]SNZ00137.1 thiol peroxidase (atypical 2-Cys peroxiredoxin) [Allomuricauda parva]